MLLGQRIARLTTTIKDQPKKSAALEQFQLLADDRNSIVHGVGKVFVDGVGQWLLTLEVTGRSGSSRQHITRDEAEKRANRLKSVVDRLSAAFPA